MRKRAALLYLLLSITAFAADSTGWQVWDDCRLEADKYFDGDSFHVRHGSEVTIIRLYFVDTPETDEGYGGRLAEQAAYFHVNTRTVLRAGHTAREFTAKFLASPFRVITRRQLAPGASRDQRFYGIVESSHGRLDAALIGAGLARTTSEIADYPDAGKGRQTALDLRLSEKGAAKARKGVWMYANGGGEQLRDALKPTLGTNAGTAKTLSRINLNTATAEELAALPGVGPKTAELFIRARPIKNLESLDAIPGIGPKKIEALRDLVRFE